MPAVDTNVLLRLIVGDDRRQAAAAERFVAEGAWVSHLALAEAVWVLSCVYNFDAGRLLLAVEMLLGQKSLIMQDRHVVTAALGAFRRNPSLGFSDCLLLEIARAAGQQPLGTFDRGLAKLEGAIRV
jgi:predicted nucleic-acid-binding protein